MGHSGYIFFVVLFFVVPRVRQFTFRMFMFSFKETVNNYFCLFVNFLMSVTNPIVMVTQVRRSNASFCPNKPDRRLGLATNYAFTTDAC